ncbi:hypothetical protein L1887_62379 [Cichorium endivia]|nr:hypothetical protein L1887_62379 [Cichorium endivia]
MAAYHASSVAAPQLVGPVQLLPQHLGRTTPSIRPICIRPRTSRSTLPPQSQAASGRSSPTTTATFTASSPSSRRPSTSMSSSSTSAPTRPSSTRSSACCRCSATRSSPSARFTSSRARASTLAPKRRRRRCASAPSPTSAKPTDGLDHLLEQADTDVTGEKMLEAVQTLCVLVVYEYGSGRAIKARLKADQALGLAMGQGLHKLSHTTSPNEAKSARSSFAYISNAHHPLTSLGVDPSDIFEMSQALLVVRLELGALGRLQHRPHPYHPRRRSTRQERDARRLGSVRLDLGTSARCRRCCSSRIACLALAQYGPHARRLGRPLRPGASRGVHVAVFVGHLALFIWPPRSLAVGLGQQR